MANPKVSSATVKAGSQEEGNEGREVTPFDDIVNYAKAYAKEKPEMAALWCFGAGFVLGWKLKPW
ncbi:hypothetical protein [Planctomicrobium sp. SH527]|uniref:hypothetical protein n=1 Tax=Planctomicrobium sp. SH527 TaxID=3448123 RepID=UPI003F5B13CC